MEKTPGQTPAEKKTMAVIRAAADVKYSRRYHVLAARLKWPISKLSKLLNGDQSARLPEVFALCTCLGLTVSQVMQQAGI